MENLKWNVYREDINHRCFYKYNIFSHGGFVKDLKELIRKLYKDYPCGPVQNYAGMCIEYQEFKNKFEEGLKRILKYHFWAKCEMELLLTDCPSESFKEKIDVYDQLELNWNNFFEYVWKLSKNQRFLKDDE